MRTTHLKFAVAAAAFFGMLSTASAEVRYSLETESGFAGKGDVQTALGLNNNQLQSSASSLTFTLVEVEILEQLCEKGETQQQTRQRTSNLSSTVAYEPRTRNQITGFNLGAATGGTETFDGNLNCPNPSSGWAPSGEPQVVFSSVEVKVNGVSLGVLP